MKKLLSLAVLAAGITLPAQAAPFTLFIYEDPAQLALRPGTGSESQNYWSAYDAYGKALSAAGILRGGAALDTNAKFTQVTGKSRTAPGAAYAPSPLALGGYFQIDVGSEAEAVDWAHQAPIAGNGLVEIRAGYPVPMMRN